MITEAYINIFIIYRSFRNLARAIRRFGGNGLNLPKFWKVIQVLKKVTAHPK